MHRKLLRALFEYERKRTVFENKKLRIESAALKAGDAPILYGFSNKELVLLTASATITLTTSACYAYSCWRK